MEQYGMEEGFIECRGFRVHYRLYGKGKPSLIVLLHGSFLSMRSWFEVAGPLSEQAAVLVFDRPAFGQTSKPLPSKDHGVAYSPEAQSDLVVELIGQFGYSDALLVGNSTGGTLALLTALRTPDKVRGIVLCGAMIYSGYATSEVPGPVKPFLKMLTPVFFRVMRALIMRLFDRNIRGFWYKQERLTDEQLAAFRSDLMQGAWARSFWELFLETHHLHFEQRTSSVGCPVLVVTGEHDLTVKTEESFRLAEEIPGAELAVVPDAAHLPQEEAPEGFLEVVRPFVGRIC
ncbi:MULTISPECIES: alpha/beta fold hydrolase [Prosthecochloris]|uniref:Alpha/beta hydrolase n=1 Tax=Prosthecochloris vibrioformis TaxID=1098 RepID=A0A5C4S059_PROVB|nr:MULTISPECIES: alpha/beta hydrolase [Prosthecochloris]ANT65027.1 2-hydroxy-6-oxononadienedioate/2-hydroxy-6-oxononatrienedioate hydrolase [Prosthecochloris sp. CIB 2401]TNJ36906.1 alpha/beta hydrolase [Prosthecochloris vibrioformis]